LPKFVTLANVHSSTDIGRANQRSRSVGELAGFFFEIGQLLIRLSSANTIKIADIAAQIGVVMRDIQTKDQSRCCVSMIIH
jgi:hypothetical protein